MRVNDLTVDEEKLGMLTDPDEGFELREDVVETLTAFLASDQRCDDADGVFRALGLD